MEFFNQTAVLDILEEKLKYNDILDVKVFKTLYNNKTLRDFITDQLLKGSNTQNIRALLSKVVDWAMDTLLRQSTSDEHAATMIINFFMTLCLLSKLVDMWTEQPDIRDVGVDVFMRYGVCNIVMAYYINGASDSDTKYGLTFITYPNTTSDSWTGGTTTVVAYNSNINDWNKNRSATKIIKLSELSKNILVVHDRVINQ